jgi:hypothetical protein
MQCSIKLIDACLRNHPIENLKPFSSRPFGEVKELVDTGASRTT